MSLSKDDVWKPIAERMLTVQGMRDLTHAERTLVSVLAFHDGKRCCPALSSVAGSMGISLTRAKELLASIKTKGRVKVKQRRRTTSVYTIRYDAPMLEVLNTSTSRNELRSAGNLTTNLDLRSATMKENNGQARAIGFCVSCGFTRMAGDVACCACGDEAKPFMCAEHELETGIIALPFGVSASGLDTPAGRLVFLSEAGQQGLREAYAVIFGDVQPEGVRQ